MKIRPDHSAVMQCGKCKARRKISSDEHRRFFGKGWTLKCQSCGNTRGNGVEDRASRNLGRMFGVMFR